MMRIVSVDVRTIRWPIASRGAARGRTERAAVVLEVRSEAGVVGLGEAAPLPGMSVDTIEDAERAASALAALAPFEIADREAAFALARATVLPAQAEGRSSSPAIAIAGPAPAARFAIETALLDALARERRISFGALLGSTAPQRVPLAAVVDDAAAARAAFAAGIRCLKVKLGPACELERVLAIAAAAPDAVLRIDGNSSWPRAEVAARLAALAPLPIDYVEEPCVNARELLRGELACRIALDESLAGMPGDDLDAALRQPSLAALVLKPTLLGLATALALARLAARAGVAAIASHGLEGPIGTAACAELALAIGGNAAVGLAAHPGLDGWQLVVPQLAADHVHPASAAGLGFAALDLAGVVTRCAAAAGARGGPGAPAAGFRR